MTIIPSGGVRNFMRLIVGFWCAASLTVLAAEEQVDPLSYLVAERPRLLLNNRDLADLRQRLDKDPTLASRHQALRKKAEEMLNSPAITYDKSDGYRLLPVSRRALHQITTLALLWRLDGDERFAKHRTSGPGWPRLPPASRISPCWWLSLIRPATGRGTSCPRRASKMSVGTP